MTNLKNFKFNYTDLAFMRDQIGFKPLFDATGKAVINWNGVGAVYDAFGNVVWNGLGLSAEQAIASYGTSFSSYTTSEGLRNIVGLANNLFNPAWGNTDQPFMQRTQVVFDNYVKPLAASDPNAYYALKFATLANPVPVNPDAADYTKTATSPADTVIDYTPRMISRTVTTAGVIFETAMDGDNPNHLVKDANGFTSVTNYGMLETLGQQDNQPSFNADGSANTEWFIGATNPGVAPVNGWFVLFGQFFDHGLDFVGKGGDGTKIVVNLAPDDPMYGVIDPNSGMPATKITISRADVSGYTADGSPQWINHTSPFIDQSQTYGSHAQVTDLLREWVMDPATGQYRPGMNMFDGHVSTEWVNAWGETTTATLPTLNELRANLVATGRADLTWEDVLNLRERDAHGQVVDTDAQADGIQAVGTGAALLLDMNPRFDAARFTNPLNPEAGADFDANITTLANAAQALNCTFGYDQNAGTIFLDVPGALLGPPGTPDMHFTGASALYFWVDFSNFSIKTSMQAGPSIIPVAQDVHDAVSDLLLAAVGDHYIAGDGRVNENIGLTAVHHVFHEEHNYQVHNIVDAIIAQDAREVALDQNHTYQHDVLHDWQINTGAQDGAGNYTYGTGGPIAWDEEKIFQAAKMTVEMEYQHTAVDQFARTITPNLPEFVGYNSGENSTISVDFAQVAYRFGHSTLRESIDTMDPNGSLTGAITRLALEQAFLSPEKFGTIGAGALALGMTHQQANEIDEFITPALNQGLLGQPLDLAAINIARGRDMGVPTLNDMREALQLTRYGSWADFGANMIHPDNLVNFIAAYSFDGNVTRAQVILDLANDVPVDPQDNIWNYDVQQAVDFLNNSDSSLYGVTGMDQIDCWLGGLAEVHVLGGILGETFDTIFVDQIGRLMDGDRFYYLQRLAGINYGQEIIDEQFKDIIERNTGVTHLNGSAFAYADQYLDLAAQADVNAKTEHKYGAQLAANPTLGVFSDGGTTTGLNGNIVTIGGKQYIRDLRTPDADTKAGNAAGFALDGAPNSGADSSEVIVGTNRDDLIYARGGDDTVYGEDGNDIIYGGGGIDRLYGGNGDDRIYGGDGAELIDGGDGDDVLFGEQSATAAAGVDQVIGGAGNDYVDGGVGIDKLSGSAGDDVIFGGGDTDPFTHGGDGNDYIDGGVSGDLLWGDGGDDLIVGQADQDIVAGMDGDDILRPGPLSRADTGGGDEVMGGDGVSDAGANGKGVGFDLIDLSDWQAAPVGALIDFDTQQNPAAAIDTTGNFPAWIGIEGAIGTQNDDTFLGDTNGNWLIGGSGNDVMQGGAGNDLIVGDGVRLDTLIGTYNSNYDQMFDDASHRATGFIQSNGLLDAVGWGDQKHFTEMLKSAMFKDMVLGGSEITKIWRNGMAQTTGESAGQIGDGGVAGSADVAVYSGLLSEYNVAAVFFDLSTRTVVASANASTIMALKITDTVADRDGQDIVIGVEQFRFSNGAGGVVNFTASQLIPFPATGAAIISDTTPTEGNLLSVDTTTINDLNGLGPFSYQWQRSTNGTTWSNITGATNSTFLVPDAPGTQLGALADQYLRVRVSFTDGSGHAEAITSDATTRVGANYDAGASNRSVTFNGTHGDNIIVGSRFSDTLRGNAGNDIINGGAGNDSLFGDQGDDVLTGGSGNDAIAGGAGTDTAVFIGAVTDFSFWANTTRFEVTDIGGTGGTDTLSSIEIVRVGGTDYTVVSGSNGSDALNGGAGSQILLGMQAADTIDGGDDSDIISGGAGNDTINGGAGDDYIFQVSNTDGRDFVDGGAGTDTYILTGDNTAETFTIMTRAVALGAGHNMTAAQLGANTEIVITRNGTGFSSVVALLDNIEEIKINTLLTTVNAPVGNGVVDSSIQNGLVQGDTIVVEGDFNAPFTSLAFNTIRVVGSNANDTIDISGLTSAHRVVFDSNGGSDTFIGGVRPQDVVNISGIPDFSASDLHLSDIGTGVESDFQLMELVNHATVAANDLVDHFTLQSGHEMVGLNAIAHADLTMNSHFVFSGLAGEKIDLHKEMMAGYAIA